MAPTISVSAHLTNLIVLPEGTNLENHILSDDASKKKMFAQRKTSKATTQRRVSLILSLLIRFKLTGLVMLLQLSVFTVGVIVAEGNVGTVSNQFSSNGTTTPLLPPMDSIGHYLN